MKKHEIIWPNEQFTINDVKQKFPTISRTTILNRAKVEEQEGKLRRIEQMDNSRAGRPSIVFETTRLIESAKS
jgi:hypothetical protein